MKRWIGCDVGASGAFAMIPEEGDIEIYPMDKALFREMCREWCMDECIACVEKVASSPQMGVKSAFSFGGQYERVTTMLFAFYIPFEEVVPNKWKAEFSLKLGKDVPQAEKKKADIYVCQKLYPKVSLRRTPKCRTDDDNFADALLLATYAKRKF